MTAKEHELRLAHIEVDYTSTVFAVFSDHLERYREMFNKNAASRDEVEEVELLYYQAKHDRDVAVENFEFLEQDPKEARA